MHDDPYRVLGIRAEASDEQVKAAWRARLQAHHPDRAERDGAAAVERAEAEAKRINAAYAAIKQARAGDLPPSRSAPRRTRVRRRKVQPDVPVDARDALRRAKVAVEYADTLCARWKRHAASIRAARKSAIEAAETAGDCAERNGGIRHAAVAHRDGVNAAMTATAEAIVAEARQAADAAEAAAERAEAGRGADRSKAVAATRRHAATARQSRPDPHAAARRVRGAWRTAHAGRDDAAASTRGADREARVASTAAKRGREALNRARQAVKGLKAAVGDADKAIARAHAAAAFAAGLCAADLESAPDEERRFVAERAVSEARKHRMAAEQLSRDQRRVVDALDLVPERMAEIRGLANRATEAAKQARRDADIATAAAAEAEGLADRAGRAVIEAAEAAIADALARAEAAAARVGALPT